MSLREEIKNDILSRAEEAVYQAHMIREIPGITEEQVQTCVHKYVCMKFFLEPEECEGMNLNDMAELSLDRAIDMNLPMAAESERATTCGTAGSAPMKIALLLNALRKDIGVQVSPYKLGMVQDTKELGSLIYDALNA